MSTRKSLDMNFHWNWTDAGSKIVKTALRIDTVTIHVDPNPIGEVVRIGESS